MVDPPTSKVPAVMVLAEASNTVTVSETLPASKLPTRKAPAPPRLEVNVPSPDISRAVVLATVLLPPTRKVAPANDEFQMPAPETTSFVVGVPVVAEPMDTLLLVLSVMPEPMAIVLLEVELLFCTVRPPPKVALALLKSKAPTVVMVLEEPKSSVFVARLRFWFASKPSVP